MKRLRGITVGALPEAPTPDLMLRCPDCGDTMSCTRGDYFMLRAEHTMMCVDCAVPVRLVRKVVTYKPVKL